MWLVAGDGADVAVGGGWSRCGLVAEDGADDVDCFQEEIDATLPGAMKVNRDTGRPPPTAGGILIRWRRAS